MRLAGQVQPRVRVHDGRAVAEKYIWDPNFKPFLVVLNYYTTIYELIKA